MTILPHPAVTKVNKKNGLILLHNANNITVREKNTKKTVLKTASKDPQKMAVRKR